MSSFNRVKLPAIPISWRCEGPFSLYTSDQMYEYARRTADLNFPQTIRWNGHELHGSNAACNAVAETLRGLRPKIGRKGKEDEPVKTKRPFDLEAAKAGAPLVTRDGRSVRFVGHVPEARSDCRVLVFIDGESETREFPESGVSRPQAGPSRDLFMAPPAKRTVWVNTFKEPTRGGVVQMTFASEDAAKSHAIGAQSPLSSVAVPKEMEE